MIMIGFFIIYFIEELVDYYWVKKAEDAKKNYEDKDGKVACLEIAPTPKTYERFSNNFGS